MTWASFMAGWTGRWRFLLGVLGVLGLLALAARFLLGVLGVACLGTGRMLCGRREAKTL